jgi:nucleotide-binding universal stress UspA family protein
MSEESGIERSNRIVLVVGVDLSDVSEHLLSNARQVLRSAAEGELHVVHAVPREPLTERITHPLPSPGAREVSGTEAAQFELKRLCAAITDGSSANVVIHTPVGDAAHEVVRVAREVGADLVLVETHDDKRLFHVSVATQIVHSAPCSVLTLRSKSSGAAAKPTKASDAVP